MYRCYGPSIHSGQLYCNLINSHIRWWYQSWNTWELSVRRKVDAATGSHPDGWWWYQDIPSSSYRSWLTKPEAEAGRSGNSGWSPGTPRPGTGPAGVIGSIVYSSCSYSWLPSKSVAPTIIITLIYYSIILHCTVNAIPKRPSCLIRRTFMEISVRRYIDGSWLTVLDIKVAKSSDL